MWKKMKRIIFGLPYTKQDLNKILNKKVEEKEIFILISGRIVRLYRGNK